MKKLITNKMFIIFALLVCASLLYINRTSDTKSDEDYLSDYQSENQSEQQEPLKYYSDTYTFGDAFREARNKLGDDQEFYFNDELYTTSIKDWSN